MPFPAKLMRKIPTSYYVSSAVGKPAKAPVPRCRAARNFTDHHQASQNTTCCALRWVDPYQLNSRCRLLRSWHRTHVRPQVAGPG